MLTLNRVQALEPVSNRWVKLDTKTGRILARKKSFGPWFNVQMAEQGAVIRRGEYSFEIAIGRRIVADGFDSRSEAIIWMEQYK